MIWFFTTKLMQQWSPFLKTIFSNFIMNIVETVSYSKVHFELNIIFRNEIEKYPWKNFKHLLSHYFSLQCLNSLKGDLSSHGFPFFAIVLIFDAALNVNNCKLLGILYEHKNEHCTKNEDSIKDFFSKCDQISSFYRIWSHLS